MSRKYYTTEDKADAYDAVIGVFTELFKELKDLGKKKPELTLSANKVKIINRVLTDVADFLRGAPDHKYLDLLDDESLPQYGDAILIMAQYDGALKSFKDRHFGYQSSIHKDAWYLREDTGAEDDEEELADESDD